jgi:hypothetical protein
MAIQTTTLNFSGMNASAQVDDIIYYSIPNLATGGFDNADLNNTILLGPILSISGNSIVVQYDDAITTAPPGGAFISFVKDKKINVSNVIGYYAEVKLRNNSQKKVELFSLGSEVIESSK